MKPGDIYWCSVPLKIANHQPGPHYCVILAYDPVSHPDDVIVCFITSKNNPVADSNERILLPSGPNCSTGLSKQSFAIPEWSGVVDISTLAESRQGYLPKIVILKVQAAVDQINLDASNDDD